MPYLDLRDLATEYEDLRDLVAAHEADEHTTSWGGCPVCEPDGEEAERLDALIALEEGLFDSLAMVARNEPTAIPEDEFTEYAEQLADDLGIIDPNATYVWPLNHIDWDDAADELKQDYFEIEFEGVTYLVRNF